MKKVYKLVITITLLVTGLMPVNAYEWHPSYKYCRFIREFQLDKVWMPKASASSDANFNNMQTQACPGFIAFSIMSWDNSRSGPDDYDVDWARIELYDKNNRKWWRLVFLDFKPESTSGSNEWSDIYRDDGNYNITTDPNWHIEYNGSDTRFVMKNLYRGCDAGMQACYFNLRYSEATRKFIEDAGDGLQIYLVLRYDYTSWGDYREETYSTDWEPVDRKFIERPKRTDDLQFVGYKDGAYDTYWKFKMAPLGQGVDGIKFYVHTVAKPSVIVQEKGSAAERDSFALDVETRSWDDVNNGNYVIDTERKIGYQPNRNNYHSDALNNKVPDKLEWNNSVMYSFAVPQLRLPRTLELSNKNTGLVSLRWTVDPASGSNYDRSAWLLERSTDSNFRDNSIKQVLVDYDPTAGTYTYDWPFTERDTGNITYYFRVRRNLKFTTRSAYNKTSVITVNTNYVSITQLGAIEQGTKNNKRAKITWLLTDGIWTKDMRVKLLINNVEQTLINPTVFKKNWDFTTEILNLCSPYTFTIQVVEGDKVRSSQSIENFIIKDESGSEITDFILSKGFFNNHVDLRWNIDRQKDDFKSFIIRRCVLDKEDESVELATITKQKDTYAYSYKDETAMPGVYYIYTLEGWTSCNDAMHRVASKSGIGFAKAFGVVNGQVLFENGQAVPNVTIDMIGENTSTGASLDMGANSYASIDGANAAKMFRSVGGGAEMWIAVKPNYTGKRPLLYQAGAVDWCITGDNQLQCVITRNGTNYTIASPLVDSLWNKDQFNHVAFNYSHMGDSLCMELYINGMPVNHVVNRKIKCQSGIGYSQSPIYIGYDGSNYVKAYLDEIRLWKLPRTMQEVMLNFDHFLNGRESGLSGYYKCDIILEEQVYDISGDGSSFNQNHLKIHNAVTSQGAVPNSGQIALRARTDSSGNYLINCVDYSKMGSLYKMTASLGAHQFSPATKSMFFDGNAPTHNNVDFTDISSFNVSGTITFAGGTYPVEGIQFKVDGTPVLSRQGGAVQSDAEGHFELQVPVGVHSVQAYKAGHVLTNNGFIQWNNKDIDYQKDYSSVTISDSTRVRFIGRICGGDIQAQVPVGFSLSRNNLEEGLYVLLEQQHPTKYKLFETAWTDTMVHQVPSVKMMDVDRSVQLFSNVVKYDANGIQIFINDSTGEFYADVYPIDYIVRISPSHYPSPQESGQEISFKQLSSLTAIKEPYTYSDSVVTHIIADSITYAQETYSDTIEYGKKQVYVVRTNPTLSFYQVNNSGRRLKYYGSDAVGFENEKGYQMVITCDSIETSPHYTFGLPFFDQNSGYHFVGEISEKYAHYTKDNKITWQDTVPVTDAAMHITNTMLADRNATVMMDKNGKGEYHFSINQPNLTSAQGTISMYVVYNNNKSRETWSFQLAPKADYQDMLKCYYSSTKKTSGDFITGGPNTLLTILRDPPGSGSYAYLDKGHTIAKDRSYTYSSYENGKLGLSVQFGFAMKTLVGIGISVETAMKNSSEWKLGWEHDNKWAYKTDVSTTATLTEKFSTASDEASVGAEADLFVGTANNMSIATADIVQIIDSATYRKHGKGKYDPIYATTQNGAYLLTKSQGVSCSQQFKTTFAYTQDDIISQEIPRLEKGIRSIPVAYNKADSIRYANDSDGVVVYMLRPDFDSLKMEIGDKNTYYMIVPPSRSGQPRVIGDTLSTMRGWINRWKYCLGLNEYQKWKAYQDRNKSNTLVENLSVAGGAKVSLSEQYQSSRSYNYATTTQNGFFIDRGGKIDVNAPGVLMGVTFVFEEHAGNNKETNKTTTESYNHTKGFELAPNGFERLSVDVLHESGWNVTDEQEDLGKWEGYDHGRKETDDVIETIKALDAYPSYIFYTRGGQTCCPHEPEIKSQYIDYYLKEALASLRVLKKKEDVKVLQADSAKLFGKSVVVNGPTLEIDRPYVEVKPVMMDGVPSGETAYLTIEMTNNSESSTDRPYYLVYKESTNKYGLSVSIDGTALGTGLTGGSGVSFQIPANTTLKKTLAITRGSVMNYDNITLYLIASCETVKNKFAVKDSCTFSVHFTPSCTGVDIQKPINGWAYNTSLPQAVNPKNNKMEHYMAVSLTNFDVNYADFDHIEIQYKPSSDNDDRWIKAHYFYSTDSALQVAIRGKDKQSALLYSVCKGGVINYKLFLDDKEDQQYDLRAVAYCKNANELVANYSQVVTGVKDTYQPRLYGAAKPADGILGINDEVELIFNENLATGLLTYNNFSVTGILDETSSDRNISVHLKGDGKLQSEDAFCLKNNFTLEGWFRRQQVGDQQMIFSIGDAENSLSLTLDKNNLIVRGDSLNHEVNSIDWSNNVWMPVALVCQQSSSLDLPRVRVIVQHKVVGEWVAAKDVYVKGKLVVGNGWNGEVDQVRVWSRPLDVAQLKEMASTHISNTSVGLVSCYNMNENEGVLLQDVSSERTMTMVHGSWSVPEGRALELENAYATIPLSESSIAGDQDYTLEFWFRTMQNEPSVLVTTGKVNDLSLENGLTVGINAENKLYIQSGRNSDKIVDNDNVLDNEWHHFTLAVGRSTGFAQAYIDGVNKATITQESMAGLEGSQLYVGAMMQRDTLSKDTVYSQFFHGAIDEIRLFNYYRPQYQVQMSVMEKVDSTTAGLLFYYPLERYERNSMGISGLTFSLKNFCSNDPNKTMVLYRGAKSTQEAAPVATTSALTYLDQKGYTFTPTDKGINFKLITPLARIEHSILTFTAKDVYDANGNKMISPVTWSAYVDRNPLVVAKKNISLTTLANEPVSFEIPVTNRSGAYQSFTLEGMPTWLSMKEGEYTVAPNDQVVLHFQSNESLPIGTHTAHLYLSNSDDVVIPICVTIIVEGDVPEIVIDTKRMLYSMNVIGRLVINDVVSTDTRDLILVYNNKECVGYAYNTYYKEFDSYFVHLTVHSETLNSDILYYALYDASSGQVYEATSNAAVSSFGNNKLIGSPADPVIFRNTRQQYRMYDINQGWNWISFNVVPENSNWNINKVLGTANWTSGDMIKLPNKLGVKSDFTSSGQWSGTLTDLNEKNAFLMHLNQDVHLDVLGTPVDPSTVHLPLVQGWNYIAYLPQVSLSVQEAMSNYADVQNNATIKSLTQFAIYYNGSWVGTLKTMQPGQGYMLYHKGKSSTLTYPSTYAFSSVPKRLQVVNYATNMSLVAQPVGIEAHEGDVLTAYNGGEAVGVAQLTDGVWYMSIAGDAETTLNFVYTGMDGQKASSTQLRYGANTIIGQPNAPQPIEFAQTQNEWVVYPSPVQHVLYYTIPEGAEYYTIYSLTGECLLRGQVTGSVQVEAIPSGVYIIEITTQTRTYRTTFIKE